MHKYRQTDRQRSHRYLLEIENASLTHSPPPTPGFFFIFFLLEVLICPRLWSQAKWAVHFKDMEKLQFSSVAQLCPTLCDSMNHSTPGLPVHHQHPEFTQTHVHPVGDGIQPSHPLSSPPPPDPNPSQHQDLCQ